MAAPDGSTTVPSMVPALPSDWARTGAASRSSIKANRKANAMVLITAKYSGNAGSGHSLFSRADGKGMWAGWIPPSADGLPAEEWTDVSRLALTHDESKGIGQCDQPPLTGELSHFLDVVQIDDGVAVDTLKSGACQAGLQSLEALAGK